jgi:hypothetical protein
VNLLIEEYLTSIQTQLLNVISNHGEVFLQSRDAAGLCATCLAEGVDLPPDTLLRTCQVIVGGSKQQSEYVGELPSGEPMYMVSLEL